MPPPAGTGGGYPAAHFFPALTVWRLGRREESRTARDEAARLAEKNAAGDAELRQYRAEAGALLGLER